MMNGERKVAVVTGAAKGIGQELAARLAGRGDALALLDVENCDETLARIEAAGGEAIYARCDVGSESDWAAARDAVRQILVRHGYRATVVSSGEDALALYDRDPARFQLVITDLMMPGMDGAALLRHLRQSAPTLKAIAMTGGLSRAEMAQALEAESAEFLLKPFDAAVLLETVRRALRA